MKRKFLTLGLAVGGATLAHGQFTPIPIAPSSYNHDVVVEASAPPPINMAVNVTMDGGTNKNGNTWYERGYNPAAPTTGIPVAGSIVTDSTGSRSYQMPPDYHTNNVIMVGHNNGGRTPLLSPGTLTVVTPRAFTSLSFLASSGNGPVTVGYNVHYADTSVESGTFNALDWFNTAGNVFNAAGRVSTDGGVQNVGASPAGAVFSEQINLGNPAANVTSVDFYYVGSGTTGNLTNNNGRAVIFAISGSVDGATYTPIEVTGFTYDAVVEADGPQTTGTGVASATNLLEKVTATMDGGLNKFNNCWYEKGYYAAFPNTGIPAAGATVTSATLPATYTMPPSYTANNAVLLSSNVTSASITLSGANPCGALSFLCATANGDTFIPCVVQFQDGSSENNVIFVPDWFNRVLPWSYLAFGRVNPNNNSLNNTPDRFVNPFASGVPGFDYRGLGLPVGRFFDAVIALTNTTSAVTNVALSYTNGLSTRVAAIFAVSGAPADKVPPVFGYAGTPRPGQPGRSVVNNVTQVKAWEGTNNVVLGVTNIAGTAPISYQWKKAARGGGLLDMMYSVDYSTFANVADGGRISGATSSALVISNALPADSADYLVVATTPGGSVTSCVATVMILTTNRSLLVGVPGGDVISQIAGDGTPAAESVDHAIDRVAQKWLSDGLQFPGACCGGPTPFVGPVGFTVTPVSGSSIVSSMRFYTANDADDRDPFDYGLEGSNDGANWTPITGGVLRGTLSLPTGRNGTGSAALDPMAQNVVEVDFINAIGYRSYRFSITNNYDPLGTPLMQIAEVELLGTLVANPPVWVRQPPASVTVYAGTSPSFTVEATGYPAPRYQWYRGSTLIAGATAATYTFPNIQLADTGTTLSCMASNNFGTISSSAVTITVLPLPTQAYPAAVLADQAVGYWRLNEGPDNGAGNNGVITRDYSGGHDGYYSNSVIAVAGYNPTAVPDTAAEFGSTTVNSYVADIKDVSFARGVNTSGATFSVEAWALGGDQTVDAAIVTKGYNGILTAGTGTGTEQFVLDVSGAAPRKFRFFVRDAAGNAAVAQSAAVPFVLDPGSVDPRPVWHHLVGVCDQANGKVHLYVDGLLAASGDMGTNVGILAQPLPMTIGARQSSGAAEFDQRWVGRIDDVALYNSALSPSQVLNHYFAAELPPIITLQPTKQTTPENVVVTFASAAYGAGTLNYQWYLSDGANPTAPVAGQTSSNLTFTTTAAQNGNNYQLVVNNQYGSVTGAVAQLSVVSGGPSFFVDLPASDTFSVGHVIRLWVEVGGTAPFTYQWRKDGVNLVDDYRTYGTQTNVLIIGYATNSDSGNYQVIVSNGQGSSQSTVDAVSVVASSSSVPPFTTAGTGWTMQGTTPPVMSNNRLELTSGLGSTARAAFMNDRVGIASFNASFIYQVTSGAGGADGITFCIHNDTRGAAAVGAGGGSLGYSGITPSVALAFNIYDPNTRGIRLLQNGALPAAGAGAYFPATPVLVGGNANPIQVNLSYGGGMLTATLRDTVTAATYTTNMVVDIPAVVGGGSAYIGFTGADGGVVSTQIITDFNMAPPTVTLRAAKVGESLILSWPASTGAFLRSTPALTNPVWSYVTAPFRVVGNDAQVTVSPLVGSQFFRLDVYP